MYVKYDKNKLWEDFTFGLKYSVIVFIICATLLIIALYTLLHFDYIFVINCIYYNEFIIFKCFFGISSSMVAYSMYMVTSLDKPGKKKGMLLLFAAIVIFTASLYFLVISETFSSYMTTRITYDGDNVICTNVNTLEEAHYEKAFLWFYRKA